MAERKAKQSSSKRVSTKRKSSAKKSAVSKKKGAKKASGAGKKSSAKKKSGARQKRCPPMPLDVLAKNLAGPRIQRLLDTGFPVKDIQVAIRYRTLGGVVEDPGPVDLKR